jgi:hydroxymethylpyrimidine/phosphomethylpyrimidine kinase
MWDQLIPLCSLITPNIPEAAKLLGVAEAKTVDEVIEQGKALCKLGAKAVLIKGQY